jgi:hypothetical protein
MEELEISRGQVARMQEKGIDWRVHRDPLEMIGIFTGCCMTVFIKASKRTIFHPGQPHFPLISLP